MVLPSLQLLTCWTGNSYKSSLIRSDLLPAVTRHLRGVSTAVRMMGTPRTLTREAIPRKGSANRQ
jgi:hypothetical protein